MVETSKKSSFLFNECGFVYFRLGVILMKCT